MSDREEKIDAEREGIESGEEEKRRSVERMSETSEKGVEKR